jgi:putative membrane protein
VVEKIVLVIDRDNDLGVKAGVGSPIIGRQSNLISAIKLAEVDPEDSDLNTIFGAIKIYDELKGSGEDVEIVTVCGDQNVGVKSDERIAEQLDYIKEKLSAKSVIVVTDGSEDEFVLPLVASRFKIDGVRRIVVKQSKTIESTYYLLKKMLEDPKIAKSTLTPLGIILIVYSISLFLKSPEFGIGSIALVLGIYFLIKAYGFEESVESFFSTLKRSLVEGRFSFVTYVIALISFIIGIVQGIYAVWIASLEKISPGLIVLITIFINYAVWWIVCCGIFIAIGKIFDHFIEGKSFRKYVSIIFLLISTGLILWGFSKYFISLGEGKKDYLILIQALIGAVILGIVGLIPLKYESRASSR